ncbi:MAG: endonuclease, partial [Bacteroidales bacterium]
TPLKETGYRYYITNSPDQRGINTALLYKRNQFRPICRKDHLVTLPQRYRPTRDILHVCGLITNGDTLDVLVCHFPSRSGGVKESRPARNAANSKLREVTDSVTSIRKKPLILIMGDFNDYPEEKIADTHFPLSEPTEKPRAESFYNLMCTLSQKKGSHKYNGEWGYLDQFFVNGMLLNPATSPFIGTCGVFEAPFLLKEDTKSFGLRPYRTYYGFKYEGGFSDHLPIYLDLRFKNQKE